MSERELIDGYIVDADGYYPSEWENFWIFWKRRKVPYREYVDSFGFHVYGWQWQYKCR